MKLSIGMLRLILSEALFRGSEQNEAYDKDLIDDPAFSKQSVIVPDDVKEKIRKWTKAMHLSGAKKRARSS